MNLKNQEEFLELILKNGLSPEIQVAVLLENLDTVFDKGTIRARIVKFKLQKYMKSQDICEKTYALLMIVSDGKAIDSIPKQEEIKDKLSPKNEPPTTMATMKGRAISVFSASPTATGVRATMVPTLVPIDREMQQAAMNIPANNKLSGRICNVRLTVASMAPICLALCAKAPARMNIQIISRMFLLAAPTEN